MASKEKETPTPSDYGLTPDEMLMDWPTREAELAEGESSDGSGATSASEEIPEGSFDDTKLTVREASAESSEAGDTSMEELAREMRNLKRRSELQEEAMTRLRAELEDVRKQNAELLTENARLMSENLGLRQENVELRARIEAFEHGSAVAVETEPVATPPAAEAVPASPAVEPLAAEAAPPVPPVAPEAIPVTHIAPAPAPVEAAPAAAAPAAVAAPAEAAPVAPVPAAAEVAPAGGPEAEPAPGPGLLEIFEAEITPWITGMGMEHRRRAIAEASRSWTQIPRRNTLQAVYGEELDRRINQVIRGMESDPRVREVIFTRAAAAGIARPAPGYATTMFIQSATVPLYERMRQIAYDIDRTQQEFSGALSATENPSNFRGRGRMGNTAGPLQAGTGTAVGMSRPPVAFGGVDFS
jgi:regulator of replication initiation timing